MMEERIRAEKAAAPRKKMDKCVTREVCNMVTKGTYKSKEQTFDSRYILSWRFPRYNSNSYRFWIYLHFLS